MKRVTGGCVEGKDPCMCLIRNSVSRRQLRLVRTNRKSGFCVLLCTKVEPHLEREPVADIAAPIGPGTRCKICGPRTGCRSSDSAERNKGFRNQLPRPVAPARGSCLFNWAPENEPHRGGTMGGLCLWSRERPAAPGAAITSLAFHLHRSSPYIIDGLLFLLVSFLQPVKQE